MNWDEVDALFARPEHLNGQPVDARSDIFAFGCVLYEMVTGRRAFAREDNSVLVLEAFALGKLGESGPARSLLGQLQQEAKSGYISPYLDASANVAAGRIEEAITWLQRAHDERDGNVPGSASTLCSRTSAPILACGH